MPSRICGTQRCELGRVSSDEGEHGLHPLVAGTTSELRGDDQATSRLSVSGTGCVGACQTLGLALLMKDLAFSMQ